MTLNSKALQSHSMRKQILALMADLYLYPQSGSGLAGALRQQFRGINISKVRDCFYYLEKKGYTTLHRSKDGKVTASITAKGIDLAEGAISDTGVLPVRPDFTAIMARKEIRRGMLSFLAQYPDSFNGDDELLADLKALGMLHLQLDQIRIHIWYMHGKKLLEMTTNSLRGDVVHYAKITAKGIDVLDGSITEPGVSTDE